MKRNRALFLSDLGFQYGAGVAQARQIEAMMHLGWEVAAVAWEAGDVSPGKVFSRQPPPGCWLGLRSIKYLEERPDITPASIIELVLIEVARLQPDLVVVGNIHGAKWPLELLSALPRLGCRVAVYLHDCYYLTGRCPYPGACTLHTTGCDASCPTATEYPPLAPELIHSQWALRRQIFVPGSKIEVLANSEWTARMFRAAIPEAANVTTLHLGADEDAFRPLDRAAAKRDLGIPQDRPLILCAAVNFEDRRKGAIYIESIVEQFSDRAFVAAFGHNAGRIPNLFPLGYHVSPHDIARIIGAADVFVGTALEEAFGQTVMEAQLCGCPVVAFDVGGIPEIIRHQETGVLVARHDCPKLIAAVKDLLDAPAHAAAMGREARQLATDRFSLPAHAARWARFMTSPRAQDGAANAAPPRLHLPSTPAASPARP